MMSQAANNAESETNEKDGDFGNVLAEARKAQNYTVEEISRHIKIPVHTLNEIEANNLEALPGPTFTQGYIRVYAKFLEISEEKVLEKYNQAVPRAQADDLKPRSNLPGEASSQSPLVKSITMLLLIAGIAAVIFGSFKYYQEKAGVMEGELDAKEQSFTGNSLDSPGINRSISNQEAIEAEADDSAAGQSDPFEKVDDTAAAGDQVNDSVDVDGSEPSDVVAAAEKTVEEAEDKVETELSEAVTENDIIEIFAENGSWMEVRDVNKSRLFYNMVPVGGSKVIVGKAPFRITMGNAKTTRLVINDIEVDISEYIRPNNTANISISTDGQEIIFH